MPTEPTTPTPAAALDVNEWEFDRWAHWRQHNRCVGDECDHPYHLLAHTDALQRKIDAARIIIGPEAVADDLVDATETVVTSLVQARQSRDAALAHVAALEAQVTALLRVIFAEPVSGRTSIVASWALDGREPPESWSADAKADWATIRSALAAARPAPGTGTGGAA